QGVEECGAKRSLSTEFFGETLGAMPIAMFLCSFMADARSFPSLRAYLSCRRLQLRHAQKVVRRADQVRGELGLRDPDEAALSEPAHRLHPAEDLLDALALSLADRVALMSGRSAIQSRCATALNRSDVRCDSPLPEQRHEGLVVVALVGAERLHPLARSPAAIEHRRSGLRLIQR